MRQLLIACVALAAALPAAAQTTKEEMLASPEKTAGVYYLALIHISEPTRH